MEGLKVMRLEGFAQTSEFWSAAESNFNAGWKTILVVNGEDVVGLIMSPEEAKKELSKKVIKQLKKGLRDA